MDTLIEIRNFYEQIARYKDLLKEWKNSQSKDIENEIQNSRTELQRCYPKLENKISRYGEYKPTEFAGIKLDVFDIAFDSVDNSNVDGKLNAINEIDSILNKAIGRLEAEGETWPGIKDKITQTKIEKSRKKRSAYQKVWKWIDKHRILSILGALAAIATIIGVVFSLIR